MASTSVNIKFRWGLTPSNPEEKSVLIVGQAAHLNSLSWNDVRQKLEPWVTPEEILFPEMYNNLDIFKARVNSHYLGKYIVGRIIAYHQAWQRGVSCVTSSPGDSVELWPRAASVASLPARCSRHCTPSRAHALAKIVRATQRADDECIVLVCRKRDVYASAVAIARSFPLYGARTGGTPLAAAGSGPPRATTLTVELQLVKEDKQDGDSDEEVLDPVLLDNTLSADELATIQHAADATRLAARITDTPANVMDVDTFIEEACTVAKELDISEPTIIRGEELKARGMGGLYGVGAAAVCPPALVVLSYAPPGAAETVAWVGKGIVYDTGGLSIKARASMVGMKGDCGGAAGVLGAFAAAVRAKPAFNLHAVLCLAENAVGPKATRPDDVHQLYSGRTVEINNTDAEGRLVLSDGVVYASRDLKADTIVDVATLTGAQGTATGKYHAAILSNSPRLEAACAAAGRRSGDLAHALPFAPELHFSEFSSAIADMKNSVADRNNAQASCAGLFILAHLGFDYPGAWLHVDMAAPAHAGERATGYGVALLTVLFGARTESRLLKALSPLPA